MVLFAVGAFAASFTLTADDVASGADEVQSCATSVDVVFDLPESTALEFTTSGATLTYVGSCPDATAIVRLELTDGSSVTYDEVFNGNLPGSPADISFDSPINVELITGVAVLINGVEVSS